jgi:hypothetical protein
MPAQAGIFHGESIDVVTVMRNLHTRSRTPNQGNAGVTEGRNHWLVTSSGACHAEY